MAKNIDPTESARKITFNKQEWIVLRKQKEKHIVYTVYEPTFESDPTRSKKPFRTMLDLPEGVGSWKLYFMPPALAKMKDAIEWALDELNRQTDFRNVVEKHASGLTSRRAKVGKFKDQDEDIQDAFKKLEKAQGEHLSTLVKLAYPEAKGRIKGGMYFVQPIGSLKLEQ